jgi:hypothetical protein
MVSQTQPGSDSTDCERFWLIRDYLPEYRVLVAGKPTLRERAATIDARMEPVPIPFDVIDGFFHAYWRRPAAYLQQPVRLAARSGHRSASKPSDELSAYSPKTSPAARGRSATPNCSTWRASTSAHDCSLPTPHKVSFRRAASPLQRASVSRPSRYSIPVVQSTSRVLVHDVSDRTAITLTPVSTPFDGVEAKPADWSNGSWHSLSAGKPLYRAKKPKPTRGFEPLASALPWRRSTS